MMREVAKMVLQPTVEIVRVPICCERVVLLKSLDCIGKVVACVTLRASDLHDDPLYLAIAPFARAVQREFADVENVYETR